MLPIVILLITDHSLLIRKGVVMKKRLIALCGIVISFTATSQSKKHGTHAVLIIDRMTDVIGNFKSWHFSHS